ncbi:MAG: hypothetical protein A2086_17365 [Spirochaetes bacterium GWD1_27_9]|nr:MAG: hypothetical protein A2Y34_07575 [Spirochaetes bacterium GWC1_27_15]OHD42990.1 MAG: hypothetical protein A2086_17365 [Spirochaetes bacterium GWD1_27_9]
MTIEEKCSIINGTRMQEFSARANELSALESELGEVVSRIVLDARARQVEEEWKGIAKRSPRTDIQGILDTLWTWVGDVGFKYTYERIGNTVKMNVTYCPIAEMARKLGQEKWGFKCYCCDDYSIVKGFNPNITFNRTKTLMEGHDCCNHTYTE